MASSILIVGGSDSTRLSEAKKYTDGLVYTVSGVEEIREIERNVSMGQSVVIASAQNLSSEAQNAFLKTLEEPPHNVTIVLLAENEDQLLPTVVSRCTVMQLRPEQEEQVEESFKNIINWIQTNDFISGSKWAEDIKDRTQAIEIIDKLLITKPYNITRKLLKTKRYLKANTNVRLTLENMFIN